MDVKSFRIPPLPPADPQKVVSEGAPITPPGNNILVVAIARDKEGNTSPCFLGVFSDMPAADTYIKELVEGKGWNRFDIYKVQMNHFVVWPPPKHVADSVYHQEALSKLMSNQNKEAAESERQLLERVTTARMENEIAAKARVKKQKRKK